MAHLLTLGPPEVRGSDGLFLPFPPRLLGLLAYITIASPGGSARRDTLLTLFWPELDEPHARNALNQALFQIRRRLGSDILSSGGKHEVRTGTRLTIDAVRFGEMLEAGDDARALSLYRGDFLEGFHLRAAPAFEQWSEETRHVVRESARLVAEGLGERRLGDDPAAAIGLYRRALEIDPLSESAARGLMNAHACVGDRTVAADVYDRFARRLRRQYGLEPSAHTTALAEGIRTGRLPSTAAEPILFDSTRVVNRPGRRMSVERSVALDLVSRARELLEHTQVQHDTAVGLLDEAVRVDEACAEAHAELGSALAYRVQVFGGPRHELVRGIEAGNRAIRLAPHLPAAHYALGINLETAGRLIPAGSSLRRATRLAPDDPLSTSHLARVMLWSGRFSDSVRHARRCLRDRPDDPEIAFQLGLSYYCLDMEDQGEEWLGRALALRPAYHWAEMAWCYFDVFHDRVDRARQRAAAMLRREPDNFGALMHDGEAALFAGDYDTALARFERVHELDPESRHTGTHRLTRTVLGFLTHAMRERASARELLALAEAQNLYDLADGVDFGGPFVDLAALYALRGEREAALSWLERGYDAGWRQLRQLRSDPLFESLRREERFRGVLKTMSDDLARQRAELA
jgi:DNA-binding SARP family transcriptional activator/Flp pilus assembly protein TadD